MFYNRICYNHFGYNDSSPIAAFFVDPRGIFCSFVKTGQVFFTVWSVSSAMWRHYTNLLWPNRSAVKSSGQSLTAVT